MFKPCGHRIIVRRDPVETTTASGIVIAASATSEKMEAANCQTGVIVSIGPDSWKAFRMLDDNSNEKNGRAWAQPGDYVLFAKYAGRNVDDPFTPDEKDLIILNDEDVIAVITPEPTVIPESEVKNSIGEA